MDQKAPSDRYVSFCGIDCDLKAARFMGRLDYCLQTEQGDPNWQSYFRQKRLQQEKLGQDNLYFIGAHMNNLYSYLEGVSDKKLEELLWKIEQECC